MSRKLTAQEIHNLAMNIVGNELQDKGYEFLAVNSQLKKHPQFVCVDAANKRYFVIVKAGPISEDPLGYDVIWMESFKAHARKQHAKVLFAGVGIGSVDNPQEPPEKDAKYLLQYEGLQDLEVELN